MSKKMVLIVDEDSHRAERLDFIVRLGGYATRDFDCEAAALNWVRCGSLEEDVLCLLFNSPGDFDRAEQIVATWVASGKVVPVVLVKRGQCRINHLLTVDWHDYFFVCEPESVMQTLDILAAIEYSESAFVAPSKQFLAGGERAR